MKALGLLFVALAVVRPFAVNAQSSATEIDQLKVKMSAQQNLLEKQQAYLEKQQAHIGALESALAAQQKILVEVVHGGANGVRLVPADDPTLDPKVEVSGGQAQKSLTVPQPPPHPRTRESVGRAPTWAGNCRYNPTHSCHTTRPGGGPHHRIPGDYNGVPLDELRWERRDQLHQPSL